MALSMPIFLNHLVLEKEMKLLDNMRTNGLKMYNYWIVNGIFNYVTFLITAFIYWAFGRYVLLLDAFVDTHAGLFAEMLMIFGLSQVSLSMFFTALFSDTQSATMSAFAI